MANLQKKDFLRKIRQGNKESLISLSSNFLNEKNLQSGDVIDLRTLEKSKEVENESA